MLACVTLASADVKPQKDFNISRVRLSHTRTRVGKTRTHMSLSVCRCGFCLIFLENVGTSTGEKNRKVYKRFCKTLKYVFKSRPLNLEVNSER